MKSYSFKKIAIVIICILGIVSNFIYAANPVAPTVTGPDYGIVNQSYDFTAESSDPDGDPIHLSFVFLGTDGKEYLVAIWYNNPATQGYSWDKAGNYYVKVCAEDDYGGSSDWTRKDIVITNPPLMTSSAISPIPAYTNTDLTAIGIATDEDGDLINFKYQWKKNGIRITGETKQVLESNNFVKGDIITVEITPNDGKVDGNLLESAPLVISNAIPTMPVVNVKPDSPKVTDDLYFIIESVSTDADNDNITYNYAWYKNGILESQIKTNSVLAIYTSEGDVWKCIVTPNDGTVDGLSGEDSVNILTSNSNLLEKISVFPNPYRFDRNGANVIVFGDLPQKSTIRIYTISGDLIETIVADSTSESWSVKDITSGIYIYSIQMPSGVSEKGKICIIK